MSGKKISFDIERKFMRSAGDIVLGIDEAGRGCLAGPVAAACAWINQAKFPPALLSLIDDSKKLPEERREAIFEAVSGLPPDVCMYDFATLSARKIDEMNILQASLLAMKTAHGKLISRLPRRPVMTLVDGNRAPDIAPAATLVKGDARSYSVALASIIAKVTKDRALSEIGEKFPEFGFRQNKGYGTAAHLAALEKYGPCPEHRMTYTPVRERAK
ncbi:MAG: ribonuclease HII [Rickettsiales bacterium]|nr:ribonuclease HII [Rickettsiales bacterium]